MVEIVVKFESVESPTDLRAAPEGIVLFVPQQYPIAEKVMKLMMN